MNVAGDMEENEGYDPLEVSAGDDGPTAIFMQSPTDEKHKSGFLTAADITKKIDELNTNTAHVVSVSVKGWRKAMEQIVTVKLAGESVVTNLYDAYQTKKCAEYIAAEMHYQITTSVTDNLPANRKKCTVLTAGVREAYATVDADFILGELEESTAGCTAATCIVHESLCICAYVGDTVIFTSRNRRAVPLSHPHYPEYEADRLDKTGIEVVTPFRSHGNQKKYVKLKQSSHLLGVTRTFGNALFKDATSEAQGINALPDVTIFDVSDLDLFICIASRTLLDVMNMQAIVEVVDSKLKMGQDPAEVAAAILDEAVAPNSGKKYGVDNLSLVLIIPRIRTKVANSVLRTTSQNLADVWEKSGIEECFSYNLITEDDLQDDPTLDMPELPKSLSRSEPRDDNALRKVTSKSEIGEAPALAAYMKCANLQTNTSLIHISIAVTVAAVMQVAANVAAAQIAFLASSIPSVIASAGMCLYHFIARSGLIASKTPPPGLGPTTSGILAILFGLIASVGYDVATSCTHEGWTYAMLASALMVPFQIRPFYILAFTALSVVWVLLRTVDQGLDIGLIKALPEPHGADYHMLHQFVDRGADWMVNGLLLKILSVAGVGCLSALCSWQLRTLRVKLQTVVRCVGLVGDIVRGRASGGATHGREAVCELATTVDPSGTFSANLIDLINLSKRRTNSRQMMESQVLTSASEHMVEVLSKTGESSAGDCDTLYDTESLYSETASRVAGSPTTTVVSQANHIQINRSKAVTVAAVVIAGEGDILDFKNLAKAVHRAVETSEGTLVEYSGSSAVVTWNATEPCPSHQQQALTYATSLSSQCMGAVEIFIALTTGTVQVGSETLTRSKSGTLIVGKCVTTAMMLANFARSIKAKTIMTDKVYEGIRSQIYARPIDSFITSEKDRPEVVYEMKGSRSDPAPKSCGPMYTEAFSALQRLEVKEARERFVEFLEHNTKDKQARRLAIIAHWLEETDNLFVHSPYVYSRLLTSELEAISERENELKLPGDHIDSLGSPKKKREPVGFDPLVKRESLNHDKILRRQIRDAEAEANADQLEAWGLMPGGGGKTNTKNKKGESTAELPKVKILPTRFTDHKNRIWCRAARSLGKGAFGEVWLGMASDGSLVAMKSMRLPTINNNKVPERGGPRDTTDLSAAAKRRLARKQGSAPAASNNKEANLSQIEDLLSEVGLMHKLRHENIVSYMASAVVDGYIMIVMEYLSGGSLHDMLTNFTTGTIPHSSIQRYVRDIIHGLEFLHSRDIIHRDMKPHNVLLLVDGQCKLADFGASAGLSQLAKTNQGVIGTPLYMAPEACIGAACKASDIWGAGIIIVQLFTGKVPYTFRDDEVFNPHTFLYRLGNDKNFMPAVPSSLPHEARLIATACLDRDPEARPTATELTSHTFVLT